MLEEMVPWQPPSAGSRPVPIGSRSIGVSLQPAIPRRVAPQQSPLPLHRSPSTVAQSRSAEAIKSLLNRTAGRQSRSRSSCPPPTRVSSLLCAPGVISILRRHRSCAPYRGMLVGTKGVPTMSTTPPAGRTKGCRKNLPNDPRLENGETGAEAEQRTSPWPHEVLARL
jgi:hypothetical protein